MFHTYYGGQGNDILDGGKGSDTLYGGYGNDTYLFGKGYGQDTVNEERTGSRSDKVVFGEGITFEDIELSRDDRDMILGIKGTDDSLRIIDQYSNQYARVEAFEFADGTVKTADDLFNMPLAS